MNRRIDIEEGRGELNEWVLRSIELFESTPYLDNILNVYPLQSASPERLDDRLKRRIISAHQSRRTDELISILQNEVKFPYDEPLWFLMKNIQGCLENNPLQVQRIADSLYSMTADETVFRLESAPKLNTQMGPMFTNWLRENFNLLNIDDFTNSTEGIHILNSSEQDGKTFVNEVLNQDLEKRPDLVAKVNNTYIIGEAKWVGSPGGNQNKQVVEVLNLCRDQRGEVIRIGIIDGFPWATKNNVDNIINDKTVVQVQESEYDIISALLLNNYLSSFL
ncbi:MAG: hypothetical protein COA97_12930 [Flavobacteriales bacterium]|nr:MAG: hypothetical protein COA97_12930 [Flavobacteriales bacterium]